MSKNYAGDFPANHTSITLPFDSFAAATGASSAASSFVAGDVLIYKDGGITQRSSSAGVVATTSFDGQTGLQMIIIDASDNTDAGFYAAGHEYDVAVADITIDAQTVRFWVGSFSIERAGGVLALIKGNAIKVDINTIKTNPVVSGGTVTFPTNATLASQTSLDIVAGYLDTEIAAIKAKTDNLPASPSAVGSAMTLTSGERDSIAAAHLDLANAIEVGLTVRQALRLNAAASAGKLSGAETTSVVIRNAVADSKDRITATVDADGNRSAIVVDLT